MKPFATNLDPNDRIEVLRRITKRVGLAKTACLLLVYVPAAVIVTVLHTVFSVRSALETNWYDYDGAATECLHHAKDFVEKEYCTIGPAAVHGLLIVLFDLTVAFAIAFFGTKALARFLLSDELRRADSKVFLMPYGLLAVIDVFLLWIFTFITSIVFLEETDCNPVQSTCVFGKRWWIVLLVTLDVSCVAGPILFLIGVIVWAEWRNFCDPRPAYERA